MNRLCRLVVMTGVLLARVLGDVDANAAENPRHVRPRPNRHVEERRVEERRREERRVEERRELDRRQREERDRVEQRERVERDRLERDRDPDRASLDRTRSGLPHGFSNPGKFHEFGDLLHAGLRQANHRGVEAFFQGSAVTGRAYEKHTGDWTGSRFDFGRRSDYDIALVSKSLFERARAADLEIWGARTAPLSSPAQFERLGLDAMAESLARQAQRPVRFMIFESNQMALQRPSIPVRNRGTPTSRP